MSEEFPIKGDLLYLDNDTVICGNIDKFFEYKPGEVLFISQHAMWEDNVLYLRKDRPHNQELFKLNGTVIRIQHGQLDWLWKLFISKTIDEWDVLYANADNSGKKMHRTRLYGKPAEDVWIRWKINRGNHYDCWPWDWAVNYRAEWCRGYKTDDTAMVTLHMEDNYTNLDDPELVKHII